MAVAVAAAQNMPVMELPTPTFLRTVAFPAFCESLGLDLDSMLKLDSTERGPLRTAAAAAAHARAHERRLAQIETRSGAPPKAAPLSHGDDGNMVVMFSYHVVKNISGRECIDFVSILEDPTTQASVLYRFELTTGKGATRRVSDHWCLGAVTGKSVPPPGEVWGLGWYNIQFIDGPKGEQCVEELDIEFTARTAMDWAILDAGGYYWYASSLCKSRSSEFVFFMSCGRSADRV